MKRFILTLLSLLFLSAAPALAAPAVLFLTVDHGVPLTLSGAASSVFVANPDIADVQVLSPTQIMLFGKRTGETTFMATDSNGTALAERTIIVSQDLSRLTEEMKSALPGNEIKAKPVPGGIILTGTARDPVSVADAYKIAMRYLPPGGDIINRVQVTGSNQIHIRVRFAEVQRSVDNSLGFNWQNLITQGSNLTVGLATGAVIGNGANIIGTRPSNTSLSTPNNVLGASARVGDLTVNGVIDALAQEGMLTILAEPNLTAMSGETANFLAGGEFPIPVPQSNGSISIQFQSYGISLAFTPTVLNGNRISLHVRPEVSELTDVGAVVTSNITVPALTTRKAETTVEVASGESFAIAGLMNNKQSQTVNKFPMLGDLPILGALFRSDHFVNGQSELIVIITPYIVKPSKHELALPTDGYSPPSEKERYIGLRYNSGDHDARPISGEPVGALKVPSSSPVTPVSAAPVENPPQAPSTLAPETQSKPKKTPSASVPPSKTAPVSAPPTQKKVEVPPQTTSSPEPKAQPEMKTETPASTPSSSEAAPVLTVPVEKKVENPPEVSSSPAPEAQPEPKAVVSTPKSSPVATPDSSPVVPASTAPAQKSAVKAMPHASSAPVSAVPSKPKVSASKSDTKSKQPLVLHTSHDEENSSGGLLVE